MLRFQSVYMAPKIVIVFGYSFPHLFRYLCRGVGGFATAGSAGWMILNWVNVFVTTALAFLHLGWEVGGWRGGLCPPEKTGST